MINDWFKSAFDEGDGDSAKTPPVAVKSTATSSKKAPPRRRPSTRSSSNTTETARKRGASSDVFNAKALDDDTIDLTAAEDNETTTNTAIPILANNVITAGSGSCWLEHFEPRSIADVAVHPKKLEELQNWLDRCTKQQQQRQQNSNKLPPQPPPMLCLTGPAGVGKTAALRLLATGAGYAVSEWTQPVDVEHATTCNDTKNSGNFADSQTQLFEQFLFRASRYRSLFEMAEERKQQNGRLVLVEDMPNVFVHDPHAFDAVLE